MPVLIITPDMRADTWLGATGWARGSQTCSGITPALVPKPSSASRKTSVAAPGDRCRPAVANASKESDPPGADEPRIRKHTMMQAVPAWVITA